MRLRALVAAVALALFGALGPAQPAQAVCPTSHEGGCDPCPAGGVPDTPPLPGTGGTPLPVEVEIEFGGIDPLENCIQ